MQVVFKKRPNFCYEDFILQHFKHCPLQSSPLYWRYTVPNVSSIIGMLHGMHFLWWRAVLLSDFPESPRVKQKSRVTLSLQPKSPNMKCYAINFLKNILFIFDHPVIFIPTFWSPCNIHTNFLITPLYTYQLFDHPVIFILTFWSPCNIHTNFLITP
jgi:hypothetical protein